MYIQTDHSNHLNKDTKRLFYLTKSSSIKQGYQMIHLLEYLDDTST